MILIFGGTTEGKIVAELFNTINQKYIYSTKTEIKAKATDEIVKGDRISGAMGCEEMKQFCHKHSIRLIIDAAHPFATELHKNIFEVSNSLNIETIRYERIFPDIKESLNVRCFESYSELITEVKRSKFRNILSLTGVQTISTFEPIWRERPCLFRILDTKLSRFKAEQSGIPQEYVVAIDPKSDSRELLELAKSSNSELILSKESGESGLFGTKVEVANILNIPLWVVQRPKLPNFKNRVDSVKTFLQLFYRVKKTALKDKNNLKKGYTTGTCVTAATKASFIAIVEGKFPKSVNVDLPCGESVTIPIFPVNISEDRASCVVIKDAGDDPDVTHSKEIGSELIFSEEAGVQFKQGVGVGRVTLPGLQVNIGEPAINPVPREMIREALQGLAQEYSADVAFTVTPFVPEGAELAKQTFNPRVGVIGGISILGTSGRVMPYSNEAFLESIVPQINIVKELNCNQIVISSGKRSENVISPLFPNIPAQAFIHYGNLIGDTIKLGVKANMSTINLAVMFGKAVKLAEGYLDTHSKNVVFNPTFIADIARDCGYSDEIANGIEQLTLANAVVDIIPFSEDEPFYIEVAKNCLDVCSKLLLNSKDCHIRVLLLVGDRGVVTVE